VDRTDADADREVEGMLALLEAKTVRRFEQPLGDLQCLFV
jgi:hypothetical protein